MQRLGLIQRALLIVNVSYTEVKAMSGGGGNGNCAGKRDNQSSGESPVSKGSEIKRSDLLTESC